MRAAFVLASLLTACGGAVDGASSASLAQSTDAGDDLPEVVCQDMGGSCSAGQITRGVRCTGEITPRTACVFVPGDGAHLETFSSPRAPRGADGWYYCCPRYP